MEYDDIPVGTIVHIKFGSIDKQGIVAERRVVERGGLYYACLDGTGGMFFFYRVHWVKGYVKVQ